MNEDDSDEAYSACRRAPALVSMLDVLLVASRAKWGQMGDFSKWRETAEDEIDFFLFVGDGGDARHEKKKE